MAGGTFPTSVPAYTHPDGATDDLSTYPHDQMHEDEQDDIEQLATKVGTGASPASGATAKQVLQADGAGASAWGTVAANDLSDIDTATAAPAVGDAMVFDGTNWVPDSGTYVTPADMPVLYFPGVTSESVSTPNHASLQITGDIDLRAAVALDDWTPAAISYLMSKGTDDYYMSVLTDGKIRVGWNEGAAARARTSTVAPTVTDGDLLLVRSTLDVDNGAGGHDAKFWTKAAAKTDDVNAALVDDTGWAQLGSTVTTAGTSTIRANATVLYVGVYGNGGSGPITGRLYAACVKDGIDGTLVTDLRCDLGNVGPRYRDSTGKVWTFNGSAYTWTDR